MGIQWVYATFLNFSYSHYPSPISLLVPIVNLQFKKTKKDPKKAISGKYGPKHIFFHSSDPLLNCIAGSNNELTICQTKKITPRKKKKKPPPPKKKKKKKKK